MIPSMKAEFRRLFTIRSTYILTFVSLAITVFFCLWIEGYKGLSGSPAAMLKPTALHDILANALGMGITFATIIAILFMAHEYRYNTITYTLTANASRTKALLAKLITMIVFTIGYGLLSVAVAFASYYIGLSLRDASLPAQDFNALAELGRLAFYCAAYSLVGILLATATRSVVFAIAAIFVIPAVVEPLLGLLLNESSKYLPFTAFDSTIDAAQAQNTLNSGAAMVVSSIYLVVALAVTWILFVKRDAN
jgi:ABC-2 type transport system permease protein